jgi:superfamily II DNA or RNA helicase
MTAILRSHQERLLAQLDAALVEGCNRIVAQAPTGFGKTIVAAHRLRLLQEAGKRAIFVVPALSLIDQSIEKLYAEGVGDVGVMQANHLMTDYARPIQVASVQTLQRREVPPADEIIIDEVHRWYQFYPKLLADPRFANIPIIGLTATPWTRGLGKYFSRLIIGSTTRELVDTGYLSPFRAFAPASPDLTGVRTVAGDFHEGDLGDAMNKTVLVADVVTTWLERAAGRPTLCFAVDRAHAKNLQQKFLSENVSAEYIDCFTEAPARNAIAKRFHAGEVQVVCNVGCLTTGIDWDVRCIILARPTKSEILYVQMIGRGLRTANGKSDCLILDHSDNHIRLGFVTDIHYETLDQGKEKLSTRTVRAEALPKKCPKCTFLKPPKMLQCPCCGFMPAPPPKAVHIDGELIELTSRNTATIASTEAQQRFYAEIRRVAETRGYRAGWSAHKFKEKFGHFPPFAWNSQPSATPSPATFRWVQSRNIAWAKSQPPRVGGVS